jgi:hypothetical protein
MKWLGRIREKVSNSSLTSPPPRPNRLFLDEGTTSSRVREKNESEQDFKRAWDDFRAANSDKEKEEALEKTLSLFCKIARRNSNPAELALTLVDVRVFGFVVARALVTDIERLRKASPNGQLQPNDILNFFIDGQKGESSFGANLLFALEGLVAPVCVLHQALLHLLPTKGKTEMKDVCLVITQTESSTALCKCSFWMWIVGERLC